MSSVLAIKTHVVVGALTSEVITFLSLLPSRHSNDAVEAIMPLKTSTAGEVGSD